ncbi:hypothetical protein DBR27_22100 [Flavobacterium sp. HMWF030]|nr:hypothetical protein DBR27_22100 [Flavobacterium sp. HMWF030]
MKKIFQLTLLLIVLSSCTEDVKFNNPAFQGLKDNVFWRATTYKAYANTNGSVTIEGTLGYEKVILRTPSSVEQVYILGLDDNAVASYSNTLPSQLEDYYTGTNVGSGQIEITEFNVANQTISGTFKFIAVNEDETNTDKPKVNFKEGVFYKIPIALTSNL